MVGKIEKSIGGKKMYVFKRDGRKEEVYFDKITSRIKKLCYGLDMDHVEPVSITLKVINGLYTGVTTQELDNLAAETAAGMTMEHGDYEILAARIAVSNLHKETKKQFSDVMDDLYNIIDQHLNVKSPLISEYYHGIIMKNANRLNSAIIYDRDFAYNYFGFKILERSYLLKINGKIVERPQHMLMRVAIGIHGDDIDAAIETYNLLSERYYIHSSQTLQFAGRNNPQLASSYVLSMADDSIEGIYDTLKQYAFIAKYSGGTSVNVHCIRAKGTYIAGTNGISNGVVPMLRVYNNTALLVNRQNSLAIYLEPWHADIFEFLDLKKSTGKEEVRACDLLYGLWIPDLFMKRVESNGDWCLMCPHSCPDLFNVWGGDFDRLYEKYEMDGQYKRKVKAQELWQSIIKSQLENGGPFLLYKDACNRKSNQQNLGTIKSAGLCTDIIQYSSIAEAGACHVASIAVNMFVNDNRESFDFERLKKVTNTVTVNLDKMGKLNFYPIEEAVKSMQKHHPIGIGIQGLADVFIMMKLPYESVEAQLLNQQIFETLYYGALEASCELAEKYGPYDTYAGCPVSNGILQFDMWNKTPTNLWDWTVLKQKIGKYGIRNSLLISGLPTTTTSQILGNNPSFEPIQSNVFIKNLNYPAGEYKMINHHLIKDLTELELWDVDLKNKILALNGSIQEIPEIPQRIKDLYKIGTELPLKIMFKMAADRGAFIDQSQSFNIHLNTSNYGKLTSIHFYGWKLGLKTGMYNLKTSEQHNKMEISNGGELLHQGVNVGGLQALTIEDPPKELSPIKTTTTSNGSMKTVGDDDLMMEISNISNINNEFKQ